MNDLQNLSQIADRKKRKLLAENLLQSMKPVPTNDPFINSIVSKSEIDTVNAEGRIRREQLEKVISLS